MEDVENLTLDHPWRIKESSFVFIANMIANNECASMLEFGSGTSTIRWARAFPNLEIVAIDHNPQYLEETRALLQLYAPDAKVELLLQPLKWTFIKGRPYYSYCRPTLDRTFDVILVDGPPYTTRRGREACLYFAYDSLKTGGIVILDDLCRAGERQIVKNWLTQYGCSFESSSQDTGNGLAVLKKIRKGKQRMFSWRVAKDIYLEALRLGKSDLSSSFLSLSGRKRQEN